MSTQRSQLSATKRALLEKRLRGELAVPRPERVEGDRPAAVLPTIVPNPAQRHQPFPLTDIQQAYWIGRGGAFALGNVAAHSYLELESVGIDLERLNRAWQRLIERHDMLRAIILPDGRQQVLEHVPPYRIEVLDLRGQEAHEVDAQLEAIRDVLSHQVRPSDQWPLFELRAARLDDRRTRFHFSFDLMIGDVWSSQILSQELARLYQDPDTPLVPLELSFRDYVLAERAVQDSETYRRSQEYWRGRLATLPPAPELPLTRSLDSVTQPRFVRRSAQLDAQVWARLKARAARVRLTPSGVLAAAFARVLATWSKNPRFTLNVTFFNRLPLHPQVNHIIGDFTSTILLAVDGAGDTFEAGAQRLQEQFWQDIDRSHVSGVQVLRELARTQGGASRTVMPVVFTSALLDWDERVPPPPPSQTVYGVSQTPQVMLDHQAIQSREGGLDYNWDAVEELFPAGLLDDMFGAYCHLLQRLADDETAWHSVPALVPPAQLAQRAAVNATEGPLPTALLHELFAAQVAERASQPAVICPGRTLTYEELYRRANQVAHRLRALGARPNRLVGVVMEKGWEQVVAVLGVVGSGAAYLPIEPGLPRERVWYLLENGEVEVVLTQPWVEERLEWPEGVTRLRVEEEGWAGVEDSALEAVQKPEDLAYVIFTSGSTGQPKGVMIDHRGAVNTVVDVNRRFGVRGEDRVLALSSLNFDLSVYDVFGLLGAGGTIVMPEEQRRRDPGHWLELMERERVTVWDTVPALMEMLVEYVGGRGGRLPESLRVVLMSGDWIPVGLPERIKGLAGGKVEVISLGGATEASIWSILYPIEGVEEGWKSIPYGKPMVNQRFHVLDGGLEERPVWVAGQLYIGGVGLARGYWGDEEKTGRSFVVHPRTGERLYRTGDVGRYLPDGDIEFLGREDAQVKIRGYRIELGEIEAALEQHPGVRAGVVAAVGEERGERQLVGYVVPERGAEGELFEIEEADRGEAEVHWQALVETGRAQARQTPLDVDTIPATMQLLDRLSAAYMCRALRDLGAYTHPNESHSLRGLLDEFHILPRYEKSVGQWLKVLDEDGLLKRQAEDVFVSPLPLPDCALDALAGEWSQVRKRMNFGPEVLRLLDYLKQSGENLADLLRGALDPLALFFPGGSWETAESLYQLNPASHYYNAIASLLLDTVARHRQAGQALRILELGAGTGGTTAALLPVLPPDETHYTYTDLSAFFIGQAQEKFRAYPFVHYRLLDIDQDPQRQGYEAHSFDVVVAANVLHDAHNLPQTLRGVLSLLAPHGLLLLVEGTRFARWEMVTIGLIEGLSAFEDERLQRNQPLLPPAEWQRVLLSSGFEKFVAFPEPGLPSDLLGQHVMVAQAPPIVRRFKEQALKDFVKAKLPEYMVPAAFIVLDALPLTPNGKVDRKALPLPDQKAVHPPSTAEYVAPRTEVERALVALWQELLLVEKVGMRDNFFDLGGDSLLIVRLQSKVREAFGKELSIAEMFKYPTIGALAEYLSQVPGEPLPSQVQESRERAEARREAILQRQQGRGIPPEQARST